MFYFCASFQLVRLKLWLLHTHTYSHVQNSFSDFGVYLREVTSWHVSTDFHWLSRSFQNFA